MQLAFSVLAGLAAALLAPAAWAQDLDTDALSRHKQPAPAVTQDYEPSPAIWKLADEDTTIYLFGTFHVLPDGFRWRSAELDRVVGEADELVLETSDADGEAESQDLMVRMLSGIEKRVPTSQRLSPEAGEKWLALAKLTGTPPAVFDRMPPILAIMAVGLGQLDAMGSVRENGVETALQNEFAAAGKPIGSIENSSDVFANVLAIDEDLLLAELEEDLTAWDGEDLVFRHGCTTTHASPPPAALASSAWGPGLFVPVKRAVRVRPRPRPLRPHYRFFPVRTAGPAPTA